MSSHQNQDPMVPRGMRIAAAWSWRLIVIGVAAAALIWLISRVSVLVIPLLVAILLAALLQPLVASFQHSGMPRGVAVGAALLAFFAGVGVLVWLIVTQFSSGFDDLWIRTQHLYHEALRVLAGAPFNVDIKHLNLSMSQVLKTVEENQGRIWTGALGVASGAASFLAGSLLTIFSLIFLLLDGKRIWYWVLGFLPARAHAAVDTAARAGWISVGQYVRVQIFVAFVDAVGIALGAWALGLPLVIPIGVMVFLGSFIPFMGAIVTGAIAALIALVYNGPTAALIMIGIVLLVNQIEGHILQPLVMGNAVQVHPLGVVLAVSTGALLAGIPGALFAVPLAASANAIVNSLVEGRWRGMSDPLPKYHRQRKTREVAKQRLRRMRAQHATALMRGNNGSR